MLIEKTLKLYRSIVERKNYPLPVHGCMAAFFHAIPCNMTDLLTFIRRRHNTINIHTYMHKNPHTILLDNWVKPPDNELNLTAPKAQRRNTCHYK